MKLRSRFRGPANGRAPSRPLARLALLGLALGTLPVQAQVPALLNYQGRITVGAVNFEGTGEFKFALVDDTGATTYWSNDGTSTIGDEPASSVSLPVAKGLYSVLLGDESVAGMTAIPADLFANPDVRLRVWFDDGANGIQRLEPDQRLAPSAYLADGAVSSAAIAPGAVNGTHVAPGSLDFSHLVVPDAPGAGQLLGFDGNGLAWTAPGSGDGIWTLAGGLAYRVGDVAVGTSTPAPGYRLLVNGLSQFAPGGTGGGMFLGVPNGETGITISGSRRADLRFDGNSLKLVAGPAGGPPSSLDGIVISAQDATRGFVGLGVLNPTAKLHVANPADSVTQVLETGGGTNAWSRISFRNAAGAWDIGSSRDFNGNQLYFTRGGSVQLAVLPNGDGNLSGDLTCTKLFLRPDPVATTNVTVQSTNAAAVNFVPYNTALGRAMNLVVYDATMHDATVRQLTITGGADLAEPFAMKEAEIEEGSVVVIDEEHPGRLKRSTRAYDTCVAGVVSGAGGIRPGIALRQDGALDDGQNVALTGRVFVKADANYGAIRPGDLLTTSDTPGRAMKATDRGRTPGAVLGKAMTALEEGEGEVLVLVTLQ